MAGRSQYVARHKRTGIEVQVTFHRPFRDEKEAAAVKQTTDAFAHFLGQLESSEGFEQAAVMAFMAEMLKSVDRIVADLRRDGSYQILAAIVDAGKGMQGPTFRFSKN